jgi:hypothetical protein
VSDCSLNASQVFTLQTREAVRTYVRELAGWDKDEARASFRQALEVIERAENDPDMATILLATEPTDLDDLINGSLSTG